MVKKTAREFRCEPQKWLCDSNKKNDVLKFKDGKLRNNITVKGDEITFKLKARNGKYGVYPDDILAIVRDIYISFGDNVDKYTKDAIDSIQKTIEILDERALKKHGYSDSKEEKEFVPSYLKNKK